MPFSRVVAVVGSTHIYRDLGHPDPDAMHLAAKIGPEHGPAPGRHLVERARSALEVAEGDMEAADLVLRSLVMLKPLRSETKA